MQLITKPNKATKPHELELSNHNPKKNIKNNKIRRNSAKLIDTQKERS